MTPSVRSAALEVDRAREAMLDQLELAARRCRAADDVLAAAVRHALERGATWREVGDLLNMSAGNAHRRYGSLVGPRRPGPAKRWRTT